MLEWAMIYMGMQDMVVQGMLGGYVSHVVNSQT